MTQPGRPAPASAALNYDAAYLDFRFYLRISM
jgi:hypothetical protein